MIRAFSITIIIFITFIIFISPTYAADSTPSADIKTKLEELKKEIASKAAKLKEEVNTRLQNKSYVGNIKIKTQNSLTLATRRGAKIVSINQDSEFKSNIKTRKNFTLKTLLEEDFVAALGDVDEQGVLTAKKIVLLNPNPYTLNPKTYLWGQIVSVSDKLSTLKSRDFKNIAVSLPPASNIKVSNFVILTGNFGKNDIFEAEFVHIIAQGIIRPKKVATPSAQISTKSATPKPSVR